jgi:SAM-dependent methyltransferase
MSDETTLPTETIGTYDRHADDYVARHGDRSVIADLVDRFCSLTDGERVLDAGCGPGWETETFDDRGYDPVGLDLSTGFLDRARDRNGGRYLRSDMRRVPVASEAVDGVWALASLLHLPRAEADAALAEFARVCRPGATLFVAVKHGDGTTAGDSYETDRRTFTLYREDDLRDRVERAGFDAIESETDQGGDGWVRVYARRDGR